MTFPQKCCRKAEGLGRNLVSPERCNTPPPTDCHTEGLRHFSTTGQFQLCKRSRFERGNFGGQQRPDLLVLKTRKQASKDQWPNDSVDRRNSCFKNNILPNTQILGLHPATQTIATKMDCSSVLPFAILGILASETPFPPEQGSNRQQLPVLSDVFKTVWQPHQANTNHSTFTQQARAEKLCIKSKTTPAQQTSPCKPRHLFQKKHSSRCLDSCFFTKTPTSVLLWCSVYFRCFL